MRKLLLAIATVALALTASSVRARKSMVPVEGNGKVLVVEATINQRLTGRFLLDTGASYCFLSKETAKDASVKADGRRTEQRSATRRQWSSVDSRSPRANDDARPSRIASTTSRSTGFVRCRSKPDCSAWSLSASRP